MPAIRIENERLIGRQSSKKAEVAISRFLRAPNSYPFLCNVRGAISFTTKCLHFTALDPRSTLHFIAKIEKGELAKYRRTLAQVSF